MTETSELPAPGEEKPADIEIYEPVKEILEKENPDVQEKFKELKLLYPGIRGETAFIDYVVYYIARCAKGKIRVTGGGPGNPFMDTANALSWSKDGRIIDQLNKGLREILKQGNGETGHDRKPKNAQRALERVQVRLEEDKIRLQLKKATLALQYDWVIGLAASQSGLMSDAISRNSRRPAGGSASGGRRKLRSAEM